MEPLLRVSDMLQYFETILPLVESLWSSLQGEVEFMGGGAAGGLWRHQQWTPSRPPVLGGFYQELEIRLKSQKRWKIMRFHSKMAWPATTSMAL